ncbi:MAG: J domain-containing protein [Treponema sp.]|nr:J domain-containing protein [Treponema sp.]
MQLKYLFLQWRKIVVLFFKRYGLILLFVLCGSVAGLGGTVTGLVGGVFLTLVMNRVRDEKQWIKAIEQGNTFCIPDEPFPGALYMCALTVYSLDDSSEAVRLIKNVFGSEYHADWNSMCRSAALARQLNSDLLVECLAHIIRRNEALFSPLIIRNIFTLFCAAEFAWNGRQEAVRPSHYLAELLDYHYISDELAAAYDVLGLSTDATLDLIKATHRKLVAKYHPDRGGAGCDAFMRVQTAYELILHQQ